MLRYFVILKCEGLRTLRYFVLLKCDVKKNNCMLRYVVLLKCEQKKRHRVILEC